MNILRDFCGGIALVLNLSAVVYDVIKGRRRP